MLPISKILLFEKQVKKMKRDHFYLFHGGRGGGLEEIYFLRVKTSAGLHKIDGLQ